MATLPTRLNNPGALRGEGGGFQQFKQPEQGYAALLNDLNAKMSGNTKTGLTPDSSILDFTRVYAPSGDNNNPEAYASVIASKLGVPVTTSIGSLKPRIGEFADAIAGHEGFQGSGKVSIASVGEPTNLTNEQIMALPDAPTTALTNEQVMALPDAPTGSSDSIDFSQYIDNSQSKNQIIDPASPAGVALGKLNQWGEKVITPRLDTLGSDIKTGLLTRLQNIKNAGASVQNNPTYMNTSAQAFNAVGQGLGAVADVVGAGVNALLPEGLKQAISGQFQKISQTPTGVAGSNLAGAYENIKKQNPPNTASGALIAGAEGFAQGLPLFMGGGEASKAIKEASLGKNAAALSKIPEEGVLGKTAIKNAATKAVIKQGIPEASVQTIAGANSAEKSIMSKMLDTRVSNLSDEMSLSRASDHVGNTVMEQTAKPLARINERAGKSLDKVAEGLKGQEVSTKRAFDSLTEELQKNGVRVNRDGSLNFKGSAFEGIAPIQKDLNSVWSRSLRLESTGDALAVHNTKRFIDNLVQYGADGKGLNGNVSRILKQYRAQLDGALDTSFPEYNAANTAFSETRTALDKLGETVGLNFHVGDIYNDTKIGTKLRALLSNQSGRAAMMEALDSAQATATKYGIKQPANVARLSKFADTLEKALGTEAPTSLLGNIEKGVATASEVASAGAEFAKGNILGGTAKAVKFGIDRLRGVNQEALIRSLRTLLK